MTEIKSERREEVRPIRHVWQHPRILRANSLPGRRILLVSPFPPFPPDCGAYQRTHLLLKALSEIAPVDVILCHDLAFQGGVTGDSIPASMNFLGRFPWQSTAYSICRNLKKSTLSLTAERVLRVALPRNWDYGIDAQVSRSVSELLARNQYFLAVGRYLKPIVKTGLVGRMPSLLDVDDVDFDIFAQRAEDITRPRWQRLLYSAQSSQIKAAFQKWVPKFRGLWVTKTEDTRHAATRNAAILPNIPYNLPTLVPPPNGSRSASPIILTVGLLSWLPNRDGIDRFIREGWPKVQAACPTAEYWLAGRNDPTTAERWQAVPGVRVLGFVDDLAAVYDRSWFTLCPLWSGAGTNIKVLESLAFGRTCVTTPTGHRGYEDSLHAGDSLLVASNPEDLAENCIQLIKNHTQMLALGARGREVVQREFSYERFASIVHREVDRAISEQSCN